MCPNGVEFKTLGEVTYWDKRFNEVERSMQPQIRKYHYYLANELEALESPSGDVRILYTSNKIAYAEKDAVAENVVDAEVVAIPWGGNANIKYFKGEFITADNRIAVVRDPSILSTKFVYYWLTKNQTEIDSYYRGAGIKHPSMLKVLSLEIPLPPIEIQKKIVECLDKFSALAAELQAELQLRRKQYEYYRTQLLTPHSDCNSADNTDDCNWEWKTLGELCTKIVSGGTPARNHAAYFNGTIPWMRTQEVDWKDVYDTEIHITEEAVKNSSAKLIPANCVIIAMYGATAGKSCINKIPVTTNQACCNLEIDTQKALYKYVYYCVCKEYENIKGMGEGSQNNINGQKIKSYKIPLPSLAEQARIVSILDKFEALTTSLSDGIPAEQAAQQKRYEYYRDLLLTFDRTAE